MKENAPLIILTTKQSKQVDRFIKKQTKIIQRLENNGLARTGAIGGAFTYHITPTSIGVVVKIEDTVTLTELDVTDYDSW